MSIWGEESDRKEALFYETVDQIQNKYPTVFKNEINPITRESPGKLAYEFLTTHDGYARTIGFNKNTYVPQYIQNEVIDTFKSIFSANNI
jgi:hypothetical protein